ncbi:hypothetical protein RRG08_006961 [Elysia crispata]|uniref:Uncharacterized protein n=1 Tax=Elysia crispata TaxID=231223 RepID=A0AAE0Z5Z1_9GAST|nr:hypothetical protein RRG08_006961 [Elysia crispata]
MVLYLNILLVTPVPKLLPGQGESVARIFGLVLVTLDEMGKLSLIGPVAALIDLEEILGRYLAHSSSKIRASERLSCARFRRFHTDSTLRCGQDGRGLERLWTRWLALGAESTQLRFPSLHTPAYRVERVRDQTPRNQPSILLLPPALRSSGQCSNPPCHASAPHMPGNLTYSTAHNSPPARHKLRSVRTQPVAARGPGELRPTLCDHASCDRCALARNKVFTSDLGSIAITAAKHHGTELAAAGREWRGNLK